MPTFKDTKAREWTIALDVKVAREVLRRAKVDLLDKDFSVVLDRVFDNPYTLCDVLFVIADENARPEQRVTDEEFGRSMGGQSLEEGTRALLHALTDFSPSRARERVATMVMTIEREVDRTHARADTALATAVAKFEAEASGTTSSSSPAPLESIPGHTPSGS